MFTYIVPNPINLGELLMKTNNKKYSRNFYERQFPLRDQNREVWRSHSICNVTFLGIQILEQAERRFQQMQFGQTGISSSIGSFNFASFKKTSENRAPAMSKLSITLPCFSKTDCMADSRFPFELVSCFNRKTNTPWYVASSAISSGPSATMMSFRADRYYKETKKSIWVF